MHWGAAFRLARPKGELARGCEVWEERLTPGPGDVRGPEALQPTSGV